MTAAIPHYLLFLEADRADDSGRWRFMIRNADGTTHFEASDVEPEVRGDRLDLLTTVRGLEALDEPARVMLVGCSPYVRQGMLYGVPEWRESGWRWEHFGQMTPVKNADLWQRLDQAMSFHQVTCTVRRFDRPHAQPAPPPSTQCGEKTKWGVRERGDNWLKCIRLSLPLGGWRWLVGVVRRVRRLTSPVRVRMPGYRPCMLTLQPFEQ